MPKSTRNQIDGTTHSAWSTLSVGDAVELRHETRLIGRGTVEDLSLKKDLIWVRLTNGNERRIFLRSDELDIEIL